MLGYVAGAAYIAQDISVVKAMQTPLLTAFTVGLAIVMARVGSWLANRFIITGLDRLQQLSAANRALGIIGVLIGVLFGLMIALTLPSSPWLIWLSVKLCVMAVTAIFGMALLQGFQAEMLRVFPQLDANGEDSNSGPQTVKLLDTNVIIDGRIADLCKTGFVEGPIFVPSFVLDEVQYIADSSDSMRRARGRRGLEVLNAMHDLPGTEKKDSSHPHPEVQVLTDIPPAVMRIDAVDSKLVALAKHMRASVVTNDFNLNRVAELQGVRVLNINELALALKPVVLPGEEMNLTIVREGKEVGQGVGYLEDGTMVVVGDGNKHIGETCKVIISSVLQTVAGKMIFADLKEKRGAGDDLFEEGQSGRETAGRDSGGRRNSGYGDDVGYRAGGGLRRKGRAERQ
jgi:uncharacterized protein YacL